MTKVTLHIGLQKTGTTSLQRFCTRERETLEAHGLLYPRSATRHDAAQNPAYAPNAHHALSWSLAGYRGVTEAVWGDLRDELEHSAASRALISSEILSTRSADRVARIRRHLDELDVEIVVYLREPGAWMLSMFDHQVRRNTFGGSLAELIEKRPDEIDYVAILERWSGVFGRDSVSVRVYERATTHGGVVSDLLSEMDMPKELLDRARRTDETDRFNRASGADTLPLLHAVNRAGSLGGTRVLSSEWFAREKRRVAAGGRRSRIISMASRPWRRRELVDPAAIDELRTWWRSEQLPDLRSWTDPDDLEEWDRW